MSDSAGLTDEVLVVVNGGARSNAIPDRPADTAAKAVWVDYVVALGADRTFVTGATDHYDEKQGAVVTEPGMTVGQLIELAGRLGG
ncbi:hypothetical protein Ait01nite_089470 [Actinoplanes italicus]|uniref:Uncharacterized protein n=1 Tax=Actinoplanes italicus TaxID=113567 RepID=A0A2T0JIB4_9ACTN|nr:hypothetical protein [Actinoplanes italicus]PRX07363.1 hypothetical protein CLV67_14238 [Actinoplanes italicus]GIE35902.1 hypothetical protein Ait01nite_089470 [Actinoplanes italicus]